MPLSTSSTIFQTEAYAINLYTLKILERNHIGTTIDILTDYQTALKEQSSKRVCLN